jgi:hypothetical protein
MKKILNFIDTWGIRGISPLVLIICLKTCATNGKIKHSEDILNNRIDSLTTVIDRNGINLKNEIKIEGLKSEKRMIQSTDRRILDVERQTEIDNEIKTLEK